jgi:hypothetical protein
MFAPKDRSMPSDQDLDPDDDTRPLGVQLEEARAKVRDQILRQQSTPSWGPAGEEPSGKEEATQELEAELAQIEEALANLPKGA